METELNYEYISDLEPCNNRCIQINRLRNLKWEPVTFKKKSFHFLSLGENEYVWLIKSGWMLAFRTDCEGHSQSTGFNGPGELLGLVGFSGICKDLPIYCLSDVQILKLKTVDFIKKMESDPDLSTNMVYYISKRYANLLDELEECSLLSLGQKIERIKKKLDHISSIEHIEVSEAVIALAAGAHPVSVCRLLKGKSKQSEKK